MSKKSIKDLFDKLLKEKSFNYIISHKITQKKRINDNEIDPRTVYLNSSAKTVINRGYLNDSFEEILNKLDIWINESSGWLIDKIENMWIKISKYDEPLAGSSYIPLPEKLNNSIKRLINIKVRDLKCFMWCHIRLINPTNSHPERINKRDKKLLLI